MLICTFQIFSPPTIASKRDTRWSLYGWIKVRYLACFWPCLRYYLLSRGLCWANYSSREHSWVFSSSSLHWDSCFLDWLIISCNYQCLVHLPSPVSWFLLLSWWCTSIVFFVINVDELLRITTHQYTWFSFSDFNLKKKQDWKRKTNFQADTNLLLTWASIHFNLPSKCRLLSCTISCSNLVCCAVPSSPWKKAKLRCRFGNMYRAKFRAVHK